MSVLRASEVSKRFGAVEVLADVNLAVAAGERVALMGPSGSGKSTLLNCLCGIEPVGTGSIEVAGHALEGLDKEALDRVRRESIGYVFQQFHLLPTLTAAENIELTGQLLGMPRGQRLERVDELLAAVGLSERAGHLPAQLSGGERQRVAIARAVMHRPPVILADEPTGSLDTASGGRILDLLERLSEETGTAVLLVTHDRETTRICHRTLRMKDGRIVDHPHD